MKRGSQGSLYCRCGRDKIIANGHCATCYTLKRQDEAYFGGLREAVLERDGYVCRVCGASGRDKRSITVHHRVPGRSTLHLMISLCPGCHAKVHRTKAVLTQMPALLLELWREQHPNGHEQTLLNFSQVPTARGERAALSARTILGTWNRSTNGNDETQSCVLADAAAVAGAVAGTACRRT